MKRIAKFHKVSKERFVADWMDAFEGVSADEAEKIYEGHPSSKTGYCRKRRL